MSLLRPSIPFEMVVTFSILASGEDFPWASYPAPFPNTCVGKGAGCLFPVAVSDALLTSRLPEKGCPDFPPRTFYVSSRHFDMRLFNCP